MKTKEMIQISLMAALIAVCSWICLPASVPFTMQTFGVFCSLLILGGKHGMYSILLYLLIGATGLPVFAGFRGGPGVLFGPTGGYLLGFLLCGIIFNYLESKIHKMLLMIICMVIYYSFGTFLFIIITSSDINAASISAAIMTCVIPFIIPDMLKTALAIYVSAKVGGTAAVTARGLKRRD